ncbi:MAG TPA: F0F1 ATP synthase subunit B [Anaerolineales bacterium]
MEALGINLGYLIVQILNFAIIFVVLRVWVFRPIVSLLEKRRQTIAQGLEDARIAAEARANAEKEAEKLLAEAQAQANQLVRQATERAEQAAVELRAGADREAEERRKSAIAEGGQIKAQALGELRGQVAALAIAAAQKVIGETLDEKRQRRLIEEFFSGIESGKVVVLEGQSLRGERAVVTSALPLGAQEQETITQDLRKQLGSGAAIEFQVNPSILGGLVIRLGDKVIDGSVAAKLSELGQRLS